MRFITFNELLELHCRIMAQSNGVVGVRDLGVLVHHRGRTTHFAICSE